jgi:hypothetical protein
MDVNGGYKPINITGGHHLVQCCGLQASVSEDGPKIPEMVISRT